MCTPEVYPSWYGRLNVQSLPGQGPPFSKVFLWASHFKVVHVHHGEQFQGRMEVASIKEIPRSRQERGERVVETAVSNDDRPDSHLAAHDTTRIYYQDKQGVSYGEKGARSSIQLIHAVGPPLEAINMPLSKDCPSDRGFKWVVVDGCWTLPKAGLACLPLNKKAFKSKAHKPAKDGPWEAASRVLTKMLRHGGGGKILYQKGGWVDSQSALAAVSGEISRRFDSATAQKIATVHWLFALMFDTLDDPTMKSRYQLAGVVDNDGTLVQICYVRTKSGHNSKVASLIPDETIYTKIAEGHLRHISCICHKTRFEHLGHLRDRPCSWGDQQ